jgi:ribonuclease-3
MRFGIVRNSSDTTTTTNDKKQIRNAPEPLGRECYGEIEEQLGYAFTERAWLERALTHRSVHMKGVKSDYERLEFLGDAVFDLAVAHLLLDRHQEAHEGELSKMRAALVNTSSLADVARKLQLGKFIRLSRGELASGGAERSSILADVVEAVLGAVYREGGYDAARQCVEKLLGDQIDTVTPRDPKTELQEALHASGSQGPTYRLECVEGPEHSPIFISVVEVDGQIVGRGRGPTKKASQQAAAEEALKYLKGGDDLDQGFVLKVADESGESSTNGDNAETSNVGGENNDE